MKKFMQNNIQYVLAPALRSLPSLKAWTSVVGLVVLVLGLSCNVVAMSGGNPSGSNESTMSEENTSGGSQKPMTIQQIHEEEGGSNIPTKSQAAQQRAKTSGAAPQKPATPKR